jgi:ribosomal protein L18
MAPLIAFAARIPWLTVGRFAVAVLAKIFTAETVVAAVAAAVTDHQTADRIAETGTLTQAAVKLGDAVAQETLDKYARKKSRHQQR